MKRWFVAACSLWLAFASAAGTRVAPADISAPERAYFTGHMHGHTAMHYALVEYAAAIGNSVFTDNYNPFDDRPIMRSRPARSTAWISAR